MIESKPWYLSRTIWAAVVTIGVALLELMDVPTNGVEEGALADAILNLVAAAAGFCALAGRVVARDRIG